MSGRDSRSRPFSTHTPAGRAGGLLLIAVVGFLGPHPGQAAYVNFESSQVHPITLTPSGARLLAVNTPDALLEVFSVGPGGSLVRQTPIPVGLEPVSVVSRTESEAWVVNHLSDSISIVNLDLGVTVRTLPVGDEPTDVVFANGRAFVAVSQEDAVKVFSLSQLDLPPQKIDLVGSNTRALAVSRDGSKVYAVVLNSGNQTTVVNAKIIALNDNGLDPDRLDALHLNSMSCTTPPPPYPPLPAGIQRNPALTDPAPPAQPRVALIVRWDPASSKWKDEAGQDWSACLPFRLPDHDLFVIDAASLTVTTVDHLGTTLFEVSVNPATGRIYVPNTDARNFVRFEHPLGLRGHLVDDRMSIVDPSAGYAVTIVDLNTHINQGSDPSTNLPERLASISQPGMMVWNSAGSFAYLTAIGSRKLFRVDGACLSGSCVFGPNRAFPDAVEVGEGPTGVALQNAFNIAYVLDRFSNSIAVVNVATMTKVRDVQLHDPSSQTIRQGRRFLYDAIDTSRHGDAACSSCHVSGNMDKLVWDFGNPEGTLVPYGTPADNVRFITPINEQPTEVPAAPPYSAHYGFDPQKGPMATQTLRGMLEPLHWRGDRPTMNAFNKAFVTLMGAKDIGPINGEAAGLTAAQMEMFRQFALGITFPPNPNRNVDDTLPNTNVPIPGEPFQGNPTSGEGLFKFFNSDLDQACASCHAQPFGTAGGKLGGINPGDPSIAKAALVNGSQDNSPHSDLKVPHLRNLYEKIGPRFGSFTNPADPPGDRKAGFGFTHDGSIPDLGTFLSLGTFNLGAFMVRDISAFLLYFPTGTRPAVGRNLTVPAGAPPTGTTAEEALLSTLISLGNLADEDRHCELVASAPGGGRLRTYYLDGGIGTGGLWTTDVDGEPQRTTADLRSTATGPVTFLCATIDSGVRLGGDRDEDGSLNGDDCADDDPTTFEPVVEVMNLSAGGTAPTSITWDDQSSGTGVGAVRYEVAGGRLSDLIPVGLAAATSCVAGDLQSALYNDGRPDPPRGEGYYYLARARNSCGAGGFSSAPSSLDTLSCSSP